MSEVKEVYRVNVIAPTPSAKGERERIYNLLLEAGYTDRQLKMLAVFTKALLRDDQFGELHIVFSKGKAMFIRPMPSVPFE